MPRKTPTKKRSSKPTGLLAAFAETKRAPTVLLGDIQSHVVKKAQEDNDRRQDIIHPSEMAKADWCPRATVYRISGAQPSNPAKVNGHQMETIFQEGHDIHSKWQTWLMEMDRLWGVWECRACYDRVGPSLRPDDCESCGALGTLFEYKEVPLDAEDKYLICGHADGGVPDIQSFIEVKSIGLGTLRMEEPELVKKYTVKAEGSGKSVADYDSMWKNLKRPLLSHRKQAGIYLAIAKHRGWDFNQMVFIYENKANQSTKEFVIKYSEELIDPLLDTALDVKWAVEKNRQIPRSPEFTKELKPCSDCVFRDLCYGEDTTNVEEGDQEPHPGDGARIARSEAEDGAAGDLHADPSRGRVPRTAGRSHRTGRRRVDEPVRGADEVGGVPERPTGGSRGRRTVRRRRTGEGQGRQGSGAQG